MEKIITKTMQPENAILICASGVGLAIGALAGLTICIALLA